MTDNQRIYIDPEILSRTATQLARVSEGLADAAATASSATLGSSSFGLMNSWMVPPISTVAQRSTELMRVSGDVIGAVAIATDAAADDFAELEENVIALISGIDSAIDGTI